VNEENAVCLHTQSDPRRMRHFRHSDCFYFVSTFMFVVNYLKLKYLSTGNKTFNANMVHDVGGRAANTIGYCSLLFS